MIISTSTIAQSAVSFLSDILKSKIAEIGMQKLTTAIKSEYSDYEKELYDVVNNSMIAYQKVYPLKDDGKVYFFQSQTLINKLLEFRLGDKINAEHIGSAVKADTRIVPPQPGEIECFLNFFDDQLVKSDKIKWLFIETNYKEEIFKISHALRDIQSTITDAMTDGFERFLSELRAHNPGLKEEWSSQLDEIRNLIFEFKPSTALKVLLNLEQRINEVTRSQDPIITGFILYLKALCKNEIADEGSSKDDVAKLYIAAYENDPKNVDYKRSAALCYYRLGNKDVAYRLAEELLAADANELNGWLVRCLFNKDDIRNFLTSVPAVVRADKSFWTKAVHLLVISRNGTITTAAIDEAGLSRDIGIIDAPQKITFFDRHYWCLLASYALGKFQERQSLARVLSNIDEIEKSDELKLSYSIFKAIRQALYGTEVASTYCYFFFAFHYTKYLLYEHQEEVLEMERFFKEIKHKNAVIVIQMAHSFASLGDSNSIQKAIDCIDQFKEADVELLLMRASYYLMKKDYGTALERMKDYVGAKNTFNELEVFNILQFLTLYGNRNFESLRSTINEIVEGKSFSPSFLRDFFAVVTKVITGVELDSKRTKEILAQTGDKISGNSPLRYFVALGYVLNDYIADAVSFLKNYVVLDQPSVDLKLYCKVLFKSDASNKIELLSILEKWRDQYHLDPELLGIEIYLKQSQNKWNDAQEIAEKGFQQFNGDSFLSELLVSACNNELNTEKIKQYSEVVRYRKIGNESDALRIAEVLLKSGFPDVSIDVLYNSAKEPGNILARQTFLSSFVVYPQELFVSYQEVIEDCYVLYKIRGDKRVIYITKGDAAEGLSRHFLGRKPSDKVNIPQKISSKFVEATILRVTNKYLALFDEIMLDAEDPFRGYEVQMLDLKGQTAEEMSKTFIEEFGIQGSLRAEKNLEHLAQYYKGEITFSEVAHFIFQGDLFEAYTALTDAKSTCFRAVTPAWSVIRQRGIKAFVLDVTAVCLFFHLTIEQGIEFSEKFVVPLSIKNELSNLIVGLNRNPSSDFSISIFKDAVIPHFKEPNFVEKKVAYYANILKWIDRHCNVDNVEERVNFASADGRNILNERMWNILIDCRLLVDRPDHYLLTNDFFFVRSLKASRSVVSPETFLQSYYGTEFKKYQKHLFSKRYVGFTITKDIIKDEYFKLLAQQENSYPLCLENLNYAWNPVISHISECILFLKELYLITYLSKENKAQAARSLFSSLTQGMPQKELSVLKLKIENEFSLMGTLKEQVLTEFLIVLKIRNR